MLTCRLNRRILGWPFNPMVERAIIVGAVAVVLAVGLIVFVLVSGQIVSSEAIVSGDEVDGSDWSADAVRLRVREEVSAAREARGEFGSGGVFPVAGVRGTRLEPERPHVIAKAVIPFGHRGGEVAYLPSTETDIPRLCNELGAAQHRIGGECNEEWVVGRKASCGAAQRRREVKAEAIDAHHIDPVPERVERHLDDGRMPKVKRVARACHIVVVLRVHRLMAVIREVIEALPAEHAVTPAAFACVVVHHVENDLEACRVEKVDHSSELVAYCLGPALLCVFRRVIRMRRKEAECRVTPIVRETKALKMGLGGECMDWEQLDRCDAQGGEVLDGSGMREACIGAAQLLRHARHELGEALDVSLVNDGVAPRDGGLRMVEGRGGIGDNDATRNKWRGVSAIAVGTQDRRSRRC